jgi:ATP-dependent Lon protease
MTTLNDILVNDTSIEKSKYNTRKKKVKYTFELEDDSDESDDPDYTDDTDYTDTTHDTDATDSTYDSDATNNITNITNNTTKINTKEIDKYIDKYLQTKPDTKLNKTILKEQSYKFYTNLIKNQDQLNINQIYFHIDYFINCTLEQRLNIITVFDNIINLTDTKVPKVFKILNSSLDIYYKKVALNKIQLLDRMKPGESDYFKLLNWIDTFLEIPFNIYKVPKYLDVQTITNPAKYLQDAQLHLDKVIYAQQKTKTHIIEILAKMITNPKALGSVFAIHGEAGTGKTTLIKDGLSEVFGLPFIFISLGGAQDRTFLSGSNYVYEGSACGKIVQSLKQSQCMNPIFYFDELDKVSTTDKGNEIINMLIHITDYTQNNHFMDEYLDGITIDLSRATFIFSFNDKSKISPILLDRMEIIKFNSYSFDEKLHIAKSFLLPNIIKNIFGEECNNSEECNNNNNSNNIIITDEQMQKIVSIPTNKSHCKIHNTLINKNKKHRTYNCNTKINKNKYGGVRYIKKRLEKIVSRMNVDLIMNKK